MRNPVRKGNGNAIRDPVREEEGCRALLSQEAVQQPGEGQGIHQAVAAVQNAAVAGEDFSEILHPCHPLDG